MCGIIFGANTGAKKEVVNPWIIDQYEDQYSRGHEGFGIVAVDDKGKYEVKRSTEGAKLMYDLHNTPARIMLMHHRQPTSTKNKVGQTHPMSIDDGSLKYKYLVVHNGVISNAEELQKVHEKDLGFVYRTKTTEYTREKFNDSESFAIEIARYIETQSNEVGSLGSVAFIALQIDKKTNKVVKLFFGRNTNPLNMAKTRGTLRLSSEGMGDEIEANKLYSCALDDDMKLTKRALKFKERPVIIHTAAYHGMSRSDDVSYSDYWKKKAEEVDKEVGSQQTKLFAGKEPDKEVESNLTEEEKEDYIMELLEDHRDELDGTIADFMLELNDASAACTVDIEGYVKTIRKTLETMAEQAMWAHTYNDEYDKENPAWESSLPQKNHGHLSK